MEINYLRDIEQAFLQLTFSIKLLAFFELKNIDKEIFDMCLTIPGKQDNVLYKKDTFKTYNDLIHAATNNYNITLGFTAITLESSLQAANIPNNPDDKSPEGMLRTLVYMIRCAYAHDLMHPKWSVKKKYRHELEIPLQNETFILDLAEKNAQPFDIKDIGGHVNYFNLKEKICQLIS